MKVDGVTNWAGAETSHLNFTQSSTYHGNDPLDVDAQIKHRRKIIIIRAHHLVGSIFICDTKVPDPSMCQALPLA